MGYGTKFGVVTGQRLVSLGSNSKNGFIQNIACKTSFGSSVLNGDLRYRKKNELPSAFCCKTISNPTALIFMHFVPKHLVLCFIILLCLFNQSSHAVNVRPKST